MKSASADRADPTTMDVPHQNFRRALTDVLHHWNMRPRESTLDQMDFHFHSLIEANRTMNLTRITDPVEAAVKHYADSLSLLLWVRDRQIDVSTIIDIGTGAGFPALPLAVMRPDWRITAIDGTAKKVAFVRKVSASLGLDNLDALHAHSAHWADAPEADLVVARAVGPLAKCLMQNVAHVKVGGHLVAYKTPLAPRCAEYVEAEAACTKFRLTLTPPHFYELRMPGETFARALYPLRRV